MFKVTRRLGIIIIVLLIVSIGISVFVTIAAASGWDVINLPPFERPDKENPKLASQLDQLVRAEKIGEASSFAEQSNIELINGSVRVIIECAPSQIADAVLASRNAGATVESDYNNLLQVVVPINKLVALTETESIQFIRLPHPVMPAANEKD